MKHMKKLAALALAIMMLMGLAIPAAAAEGDITITMTTSESGAPVNGHTYNVYQIFTGTVAADGVTLSDANYGKNYKLDDKTVEEAMKALEGKTGAEAAAELEKAITGEPVAVLNDANEHKAEVPVGYYLIIDVTPKENLPENHTKSAFILQAIKDINIQSKHDNAPIVTKKIDDKNDSTGAEDDIVWHDSADHDIGDMIPFQLNAVIPVSFTAFKNTKTDENPDNDVAYPFTFHDTEEKGLTFKKITAVYALDSNGTKTAIADSAYTLDLNPEDKHTFDVVFSDLTAIDAIKAGSTLVVEYESELNEEAVLGNEGNVNEVFGEFRNFYEPETPKYTPKDTVIAFTYKVVVNKVDEDKKPLEGAKFTLEKYIKATDSWSAIDQVETEPGTVFTFKGLDDGIYRLTETETPDGYNTIAPIEFTVTADHDIVWNTQGRTDVLNTLTGTVETGEITFTATEDLSTLQSDVENKSGVVLPETGGTGTTLFYIMGGVMVLVAVILLVTKKRMSNSD